MKIDLTDPQIWVAISFIFFFYFLEKLIMEKAFRFFR